MREGHYVSGGNERGLGVPGVGVKLSTTPTEGDDGLQVLWKRSLGYHIGLFCVQALRATSS